MAKKNKRPSRPNAQPARKPEEKPVTADDLNQIQTESEFVRKRDEMIKKAQDELDDLTRRKEETENAIKIARETSGALAQEIKNLNEQKKKLQDEYDAIDSGYREAVKTIETAREQAQEKEEQANITSKKLSWG